VFHDNFVEGLKTGKINFGEDLLEISTSTITAKFYLTAISGAEAFLKQENHRFELKDKFI
jgi:hypothetical protein